MNQTECARETDVVDAVTSGRWPERADAGLRAHVAGCAICADVAEVARALQEDHETAWREARIPSSARVWWRAEMRARQEAARKAAQPMAVVTAAAAACGGGVLIAFVVLLWPALRGLLTALDVSSLASLGSLGSLGSLSGNLPVLGLVLAIGSLLLIAPIAIYFVFSDK